MASGLITETLGRGNSGQRKLWASNTTESKEGTQDGGGTPSSHQGDSKRGSRVERERKTTNICAFDEYVTVPWSVLHEGEAVSCVVGELFALAVKVLDLILNIVIGNCAISLSVAGGQASNF